MRPFLFTVTLLLTFLVHGQQPYKVFNWKSEYTLNTWLLRRMHEQYDERRATLQRALASPRSMQVYRDSCRQRYKKLVGSLPPKTDLNVQVRGIILQQGYAIRKIIYESLPGHHVTASLYVPEGMGKKFPAVLLFCGHEPEAKASVSYQQTAILLAKNGIVALVIDPISQGERHQLLDAAGNPLTRGGTTEHTLINAAANLTGSGAVAYELWDNIRALDYLVTRPEVDTEKIGCLGNSGGGTQTAYFIGFDDRIKVAAPCSYIASRERNFDLAGANDGCQHVVGEGEARLEIADFLIMFSPKPLLILAGRYDFVDYTGTVQAHDELQKVYTTLQSQDKLKLFTADDGHGISKSKREAAVTWFRKWLYNDDTPVTEGAVETIPAEELACTPEGEVGKHFPEELNDFKRAKLIADSLKQRRSALPKDLPALVKQVLNIGTSRTKIERESVGTVNKEGYSIEKVIARKAGQIPLPVLAVYPKGQVKGVSFWLHSKGKWKIADSTALITKYLGQQQAVIMADLSGAGETADPVALNDPKYFNAEYRNAMLALHIGTSLPALRTQDVITLLDLVAQDEKLKAAPVKVFANGHLALPALQAAVIDNRIREVQVSDTVSSFEEAITDPLKKDWYSYVIPGVLQYYDIADLQAALKERLKIF